MYVVAVHHQAPRTILGRLQVALVTLIIASFAASASASAGKNDFLLYCNATSKCKPCAPGESRKDYDGQCRQTGFHQVLAVLPLACSSSLRFACPRSSLPRRILKESRRKPAGNLLHCGRQDGQGAAPRVCPRACQG